MKRRGVLPALASLTVMLALWPGLNLAQDSPPQSAVGTVPRPASGSAPSAAALAAPPSYCPGALFEVHVGMPTIWMGDIAYSPRHEEYMLVWSMEQNSQTHEIWAARVGPSGELHGKFKVSGEQGKYLSEPALAYSPVQDQYLVVYDASPFGSGDVDIYAKRLSWDGSWQSSQFVIRDEVDKQWGPRVAYNKAHDEYLVVYWNQWAGGHEDIAAQRVKAIDGALPSWRNIATGANEKRRIPEVAYNPDRDEYLVVYDYVKGSFGEIRGSRFNYHMGTVYPEFAISDPSNYPSDARVAAGPDEYLVLWETYTAGTDGNIRGRRVSGEGIPQGASVGFDVAGVDTTEGYDHPNVTYSETFGYLVAMEYGPPDPRSDVVARRVMPGQDTAAGELFPLFDYPELQYSPQAACAPHGHCLIVVRDTWDPENLKRWAIRGRPLGACPRIFLPLITRE